MTDGRRLGCDASVDAESTTPRIGDTTPAEAVGTGTERAAAETETSAVSAELAAGRSTTRMACDLAQRSRRYLDAENADSDAIARLALMRMMVRVGVRNEIDPAPDC